MTTDPQKGNGILKPFSWLWLAGAMLLGSYLILTSGNSTSANNAATNRDDTSHAAVDGGTTVKFDRPEGPESATRNIEDIRVGDRVLASNPEISEEERATWGEPDWSEWWHLSLQMPLATGDGHADVESKLLHIELLRPDFWVREHIGFVVDELPLVTRKAAHLADVTSKPPPVFDGVAAAQPESATGLPLVPLSSLRGVYRDIILASAVLETRDPDLVGLTVEMDLPEMGALGTATITDIKPCPAVRPGDGQVVTATFKHPPSTTVLDVTFIDETDSRSSSNLTSQASSVGVTDNHLFWSVDREAFVAIGEMALGERVVTYQGGTKRVAQKLPRPGPQLVYSLEVYGEHVYFVGNCGLLAHNSCDWDATTHRRFSKQLRDLGITDNKRRKIMLRHIRDNFEGYASVRINRTSRTSAFYRYWGGGKFKAGEIGQYGHYLPTTRDFARNQNAIMRAWNSLNKLTRFDVAPGTLRVVGRAAPKSSWKYYYPGGGMQVFIPSWELRRGVLTGAKRLKAK